MAVPADPDRSAFKNQVQHLDLAYDEAVHYAEGIRPYWLSLRQPQDDTLQWALFDYFPAAHYKWACRRSADKDVSQIKLPDGDRGSERSESTVHLKLIAELFTLGRRIDGLGLLDMEDSMVVTEWNSE